MRLLVIVGVVVLIAGVSLILSAFQVHVPLFRVAAGAVLGWLGISLLLSGLGTDWPWLAFRPHRPPQASPLPSIERQDVLFSNQDFDVTHLKSGEHLKLGVIFGDATLRYDPRTPIEVRTSTAFGNTTYPDGSSIAFGERIVRGQIQEGAVPAVVDVATVFGTTRLVPVLP